jgi:hypothetical protein
VSLQWRVTSEQISLCKFHSQFVANLTKRHFHLIPQSKVAAPKNRDQKIFFPNKLSEGPRKTVADARQKKRRLSVAFIDDTGQTFVAREALTP